MMLKSQERKTYLTTEGLIRKYLDKGLAEMHDDDLEVMIDDLLKTLNYLHGYFRSKDIDFEYDRDSPTPFVLMKRRMDA